MSADPPRKAYKYTCNMIRPQIYSEKSLMESVVDFFSDVVPQAYTGTQRNEDKEKIQWVRFETCDCNDVAKNPDLFRSDTKGLPLLLILGYSNGVQIWYITPNGEAQEILSIRQGPIRMCRILPNPDPVLGNADGFKNKRPLAVICDSSSAGQPYCGVKFVSLKTGDEVHSISFKTLPVQSIECNKRFVVIVFLEKVCIHEACQFQQLFWITSCFPCPGPTVNPIALSTRWLAYADKRLVAMHQSCGGMSGDGSQSYAATVISAAKGAFKGLSMFGEAMVNSVTGSKPGQVKKDCVQLDNGNRPGIVTVIDIQNIHNDHFNVNEDNEGDGLIAHFHAHANEPVSNMAFDPTGTLLVTACKLGHNFHVFRLMAHPVSSSLGAVHHLYTLHRGETTAKVIDISFNHDSRWITVSSHRGTTHLFPITPYGGPVNIRTHSKPHVVNRASRFHRSAGLDEFDHSVGRRSPVLSTSPSSSGQYDRYPTLIQQNTLNNNMGNPRLPPYPHPITIYPTFQIKQPLNVALNPGNKNQSPSHSPTGLDNVYSVCAKFCTPRLCVIGSPKLDMERRDGGKRPVDSLFVMAQSGTLVEYVLEPRAKSVSDKVTDDCLLELNVVGRMQWNLQRLKNSPELRPPLPSNSPVILANEAIMSQVPTAPDLYDLPGLTRQDSKDSLSSDHSSKDEQSDEQWLSQVEIITHAGPHRRLWMGPQFSFKTYQENTTVLSSNSSSLLSQSPESNMAAMDMMGDEGDLESLKLQPTRSNPVSMPNARPAYRRLSGSDSPSTVQGIGAQNVPLLIEAGSFDQSPHLLDVYSNWTESTVAKRPRGSDDLEEDRLKETLADAMVESPCKDLEKLSLRHQDIPRPSVKAEKSRDQIQQKVATERNERVGAKHKEVDVDHNKTRVESKVEQIQHQSEVNGNLKDNEKSENVCDELKSDKDKSVKQNKKENKNVNKKDHTEGEANVLTGKKSSEIETVSTGKSKNGKSKANSKKSANQTVADKTPSQTNKQKNTSSEKSDSETKNKKTEGKNVRESTKNETAAEDSVNNGNVKDAEKDKDAKSTAKAIEDKSSAKTCDPGNRNTSHSEEVNFEKSSSKSDQGNVQDKQGDPIIPNKRSAKGKNKKSEKSKPQHKIVEESKNIEEETAVHSKTIEEETAVLSKNIEEASAEYSKNIEEETAVHNPITPVDKCKAHLGDDVDNIESKEITTDMNSLSIAGHYADRTDGNSESVRTDSVSEDSMKDNIRTSCDVNLDTKNELVESVVEPERSSKGKSKKKNKKNSQKSMPENKDVKISPDPKPSTEQLVKESKTGNDKTEEKPLASKEETVTLPDTDKGDEMLQQDGKQEVVTASKRNSEDNIDIETNKAEIKGEDAVDLNENEDQHQSVDEVKTVKETSKQKKPKSPVLLEKSSTAKPCGENATPESKRTKKVKSTDSEVTSETADSLMKSKTKNSNKIESSPSNGDKKSNESKCVSLEKESPAENKNKTSQIDIENENQSIKIKCSDNVKEKSTESSSKVTDDFSEVVSKKKGKKKKNDTKKSASEVTNDNLENKELEMANKKDVLNVDITKDQNVTEELYKVESELPQCPESFAQSIEASDEEKGTLKNKQKSKSPVLEDSSVIESVSKEITETENPEKSEASTHVDKVDSQTVKEETEAKLNDDASQASCPDVKDSQEQELFVVPKKKNKRKKKNEDSKPTASKLSSETELSPVESKDSIKKDKVENIDIAKCNEKEDNMKTTGKKCEKLSKDIGQSENIELQETDVKKVDISKENDKEASSDIRSEIEPETGVKDVSDLLRNSVEKKMEDSTESGSKYETAESAEEDPSAWERSEFLECNEEIESDQDTAVASSSSGLEEKMEVPETKSDSSFSSGKEKRSDYNKSEKVKEVKEKYKEILEFDTKKSGHKENTVEQKGENEVEKLSKNKNNGGVASALVLDHFEESASSSCRSSEEREGNEVSKFAPVKQDSKNKKKKRKNKK